MWRLLVESYGEKQAFNLSTILSEPAPLTVRTNTVKLTQHDLYRMFIRKGFSVQKCKYAPQGIKFIQKPQVNFFKLPEYSRGFFEIQDEGSQLAAMRVDCKPGDTVLDYCGGSGGKSLAFAPFMHNRGQLYLHDIRKNVLLQAK